MSLRRTILAGVASPATVPGRVVTLATGRPAPAATCPAHVTGCFEESPDRSGDGHALHPAVSSGGLGRTPPDRNGPVAMPTG
ncbi:hypothetical protein [Streptosporangium sp. NPDC048865]|uniref:hypothetical protein n=1 Tax=Streptosporangium sp. NPDC048865 TaxID=3155766 RepID=UPI0034452150